MLQSAAMLPALPALPALLLAAGALLPGLPQTPPVVRRWASLAGSVLALVVSTVLLWLLWTPQRSAITLAPATWERSIFAASPALEVDALAALCSTLIALCGVLLALRIALAAEPPTPSSTVAGSRVQLVVAASLLFVAATGSPLGLALAWLPLDFAIARAGGGRRVLLGGQAGLFLALVGLTGGGAAWLIAAGVVRAGLLPLTWALPRTGEARPWRALGLRLPPTVAGLHLAIVAAASSAPSGAIDVTPLVLGTLTAALGAALSFLANNRAASIDWAVTSHAGLLLVALGLNDPVGEAIAIVLLIALVLGWAALYGSEGLGVHREARVARRLATLATMGVPPTLGFTGRWLLYMNLMNRDVGLARAALAVLVISSVAAAAPSHRRWRPSPAPRSRGRALAMVALTLAVIELALGLGFPLVARAGQAANVPGLTSPLAQLGESVLRWEALFDRSADAATLNRVRRSILLPWTAVLLIGLGPLLGLVLRRVQAARPLREGRRQASLRRVLSLSVLWDGLLLFLVRSGELTQLRSGLVEGRRSMAITLLGAVVVSATLLGPPSVGTQIGWPSWGMLTTLVLAGTTAGVALLATRPASTMGAVIAAHTIVAWTSWRGGAPSYVAAVQIIVGLLVVGVLAISVLQSPDDRHPMAAARRLRQSRRGEAQSNLAERLMQLTALLVVLLAVAGLRPSGAVVDLVPQIFLPAMALLAGGLLVVLFARDALHLASGVLIALTGFALVYSMLDAGRLVTGAAAGVQVLFAVVASAFVGAAPPATARSELER